MTPELWKAKKIVDSTIHPGTITKPAPLLFLMSTLEFPTELMGCDATRYRRARLIALSDVMFCPLEPSRHSRNADAGPHGMREPF